MKLQHTNDSLKNTDSELWSFICIILNFSYITTFHCVAESSFRVGELIWQVAASGEEVRKVGIHRSVHSKVGHFKAGT